MQLKGDQLQFGRRRRLNYGRIGVLLDGLILAGILVVWMVETCRIATPFVPGPTPTRSAVSYAQEGEAHFSSGNLPEAIVALQNAVRLTPENGALLAELARIQTYASELQPSLQQRQELLAQARQTIDQAVQVDPADAYVYAVRALAYDWSASAETGEQREAYLSEAETSPVRALQLARGDLTRDPRFATPTLRAQHQDALRDVLETEFINYDAADLLVRMNARGVPCAPLYTYSQVLADPQVRHMQWVEDITLPNGAPTKTVVSPQRVSGQRLGVRRSPPALGEHTEEILSELKARS